MMIYNSIVVIVRILVIVVIVVIVDPSVLRGRAAELFRVYVLSDHFREDLVKIGPILERTRGGGENEKT